MYVCTYYLHPMHTHHKFHLSEKSTDYTFIFNYYDAIDCV